MNKPREFWIEIENGMDGKAMVYSEKVDGLDEQAIHVREVRYVDWVRVWLDYNLYLINQAPIDFRRLIEKLVEEQLGG